MTSTTERLTSVDTYYTLAIFNLRTSEPPNQIQPATLCIVNAYNWRDDLREGSSNHPLSAEDRLRFAKEDWCFRCRKKGHRQHHVQHYERHVQYYLSRIL